MKSNELALPPSLPREFRAILINGGDPTEFRSQTFHGKTFEEVVQFVETEGNRIESIKPREASASLAHNFPEDSWISLPVIRTFDKRRSFQLEGPDSMGVFRTGLVLFGNKRGSNLPEEAFVIEASEAMAKIPWARAKQSFNWEEIVSMTAARKGTDAQFHVNAGKRHGKFLVPLKEARSVVESCACFLGPRFQSSLRDGDFLIKEISGLKRTIFGVFALILSAMILGWGWWMMREGEDFLPGFASVLVQYGLIGSLFSLLLLGGQWMKRPSKRPAGVDPYRSLPLSIVLRITGIAVFLVGYLAPESTLRLFGLKNDMDAWPFLLGLSIVTISLGALLLYAGYRVGLGTGFKSRKTDNRQPILYLRSFGDDGRNSLNPKGFFASVLGLRPFTFLENFGPVAHAYPPRMIKLLFGIAADTAEEQLGNYFRQHGPFRAIGKPGERVVTGGADRVYVDHDTWQDKVISLMDSSRLVVLQPAATEGVWWEIGTAIDRVGPQRLLLSLANFKQSHQDYDDFRQRFEKRVGTKLPRSLANAHFMYFTDAAWTPRLLDSVPRSPFLWPLLGVGIDLGKTLHPFLSHLPEPPPALPAEVKVVPKLIWPRALAAVAIWGLLPMVAIFSVKTTIGVRQVYAKALANDGFEIRKDYPAYSWRLGHGWTEVETRMAGPRIFMSETEAVVALVGVAPASLTLDDLLKNQVAQLDKISVNQPQITDQRIVIIDGRKWLMAEIRSRLFGEEDLQTFVMRENLSSLSINVLSSVDQDAALARMAEMNRPYRESLGTEELSDKARSGQDFVHYIACHAGDRHDFSLRMSTSARGSYLGGASREVFLKSLGNFQILPDPVDASE